jgi:NAD(P)-dependent dehydrogenase (short-subunit alcohol dehydrogenase family)
LEATNKTPRSRDVAAGEATGNPADSDYIAIFHVMSAPVILITGASRGIGFAAAKQLAARQATVIVASRELAKAENAARDIGAPAEPLELDITDEASVQAAAAEIVRRHGRLDVLVNNSAILLDHYESVTSLKPEVLRNTLDTNVIGTFRVTKAMLPLLEKSAAPRIINVSSGSGQLDGDPQPFAPAYSISKAALNMLTQQLTGGLPHIIINSMCPGWCRTEMGGQAAPLSADEGADTLVWLALDAPPDLRGAFVKQRQVIPW